MVSNSSPDLPLPPDLARFVTERIQSGRFATAAEVIAAGLRALRDREGDLAELKRKVQLGLDEAKRGELLDGEAVFAALDREIERVAGPRPDSN